MTTDRSQLLMFLVVAASVMLHAPIAAADDNDAPDDSGDAPGAAVPSPKGSISIAPGSVQLGDLVLPTQSDAGFTAATGSAFEFQFRGFLRIPLRVGFGPAGAVPPGVEGGNKVHVPPQIPDGTYTDWQYTNNLTGPWTEVRLSYGNARVVANVVFAAHDVSDASYRNPQGQLGVSQSFVTINAPTLLGERGGVVWNVGGFSSRYGAPGRYDAGKYDTYLFGATHVAGETLTAFYSVSPELTLHAEHGVGAKLEVAPLVPGVPPAPYFPYPGEEQQGDTLLHHAHIGATYGSFTVAAHHLYSFTDDASEPGQRDGSVSNMGVELKVLDHRLGDGYIGYGRLHASNADRVAGAFEALHSFEGWNLHDNYFRGATDATGTIHTLLFQHTFSLSRFNWHPRPFWGQGADLLLSAFGMYNRISSDEAGFTAPESKLKLGGEATYVASPFLAVSGRYDLVQPDMDNDTMSFHVLSPKFILTTEFASHEQIVISYSRYLNGDNTRLAWPHEGLVPDRNVFKISAVMWW